MNINNINETNAFTKYLGRRLAQSMALGTWNYNRFLEKSRAAKQ